MIYDDTPVMARILGPNPMEPLDLFGRDNSHEEDI